MIHGTLMEIELFLKVGADPRNFESRTSVHARVTHGWMVHRPNHKSHRDQQRFLQKRGDLCPNAFKSKAAMEHCKPKISRQKRNIHDILPDEVKGFDAIIVNAREKLEIPVELAMP